MGNNGGAQTKGGAGLTNEDEKAVLEMFGIINKSSVNLAPIKRHWEGFMPQQLSRQFLSYPFPEERPVSLEVFVSLYIGLVKESNDAKAAAIVRLITMKYRGDLTEIPKARFLEFVKNMVISYQRVLTQKDNPELKSWLSADCAEDPEGTAELARYLCKDIQPNSTMVAADSIEMWLYNCSIVSEVVETVMNHAYGLKNPANNEALLPSAIFPRNFKTRLSLPQVLFLSSSVPQEYSHRWRLLFSVRSHGESWTKCSELIMKQGPTLLVFRDSDGSIFGAFASESWRMSPHFYGNNYSFLYTISPSMERYDPSNYNTNFQYMNSGQQTLPNGIGMGGQFNYWGVFISSEFDIGTCSETCSTFKGYKPLSSELAFKLADMEVWAVGSPDPTPEELGERSQGSVRPSALGQDSAAEAIMEMSGKQFYSRELRRDSSS